MKVADLIKGRTQTYSVSEGSTVLDAARYLRERQVRATAVCNTRGEPLGVISQSDISEKVAAENRCPAWVKVEEVMGRNLITVRPETTVAECLRLLEKHGIYHLVVFGEGKQLYGMISARDILKAMVTDEKARADMLESWPPLPR